MPARTIIDISLPLRRGLMTWPGNPHVELTPLKRLARGDDADTSLICLTSHAGTHIDLPSHTIVGGATSESLDLDGLVGPADVVDATDVPDVIGADVLDARVPEGAVRVLFRTANSRLWEDPDAAFPDRYVPLAPDAAAWLVAHGVRLVGIDFLSVEAPGVPGRPVHRTLLEADVVILEGVDLRSAAPGRYDLVCLPLRIEGADGAPARALLVRDG